MKEVLIVSQNPAKYRVTVETSEEYGPDFSYQLSAPNIEVNSAVNHQSNNLEMIISGVENQIRNAATQADKLGNFTLRVLLGPEK